MGTQGTSRDRIIGRYADRQHGVAARWQLLAAGLSRDAIAGAVRSGRLRPLFRGVYAVGHVSLARHGWYAAALLASGPRAVISHLSAASLWDLRATPLFPIEVITTSQHGRKHSQIKAHRSSLLPEEGMRIDGIRVTTPARTIVDAGSCLHGRALRELVERAQDKHRFDRAQIAAILRRNPGRPGTPALRNLIVLLQPGPDGTRSHLEHLFLSLLRRHRLPSPAVNELVAGRRRDFVWRAQHLVVEVDGYRYHSSPTAMRRDRMRDRELVACGWRPARFTFEEVAFEPDAVGGETAALLGRR